MKAFFRDDETRHATTLELIARRSAHVGTFVITVTGTARSDRDRDKDDFPGTLTRTTNIAVDVREEAASPIQVDLTSAFLKSGIFSDGSVFSSSGGFDGAGAAYSATLIASPLV